MAHESIVEKIVFCPACNHPVPLQYVNPKHYSVDSRESDGHVIAYRWIPKVQSDAIPHLYAVWQCSECLYADLKDSLMEEYMTFKDGYALKAFNKLPDESKATLHRLRLMVPRDSLNHAGAISMHLAAIFIMALPEEKRQIDYAKLGKLSLRLAWLFREYSCKQATFIKNTGATLKSMGMACEQMEQHLSGLGTILGDFKRSSRERAAELNLLPSTEENPYLAVTDSMGTRLDALHETLNSLQMAVLQDQQGKTIKVGTDEINYGADIGQILLSIGSRWPGMPRNERQSLDMTLVALEYSYENEGENQSVEDSLVMVDLILDLLVRMGELERALEWTNILSKFGYDTWRKLQETVRKGKSSSRMSNDEARSILRQITTVNVNLQRGGEKRRQIFQLMLARDEARIDDILRPMPTASADHKMKALKEAGIHNGVISLLFKNELKEPGKPKRSFLGLFGGHLSTLRTEPETIHSPERRRRRRT